MKRSWMILAGVGWAALSAGAAVAQNKQQYDTSLYSTTPPAGLDKNYGLPTFGMQGSEVPAARPVVPPAPAESSLFKGTTDLALPKPKPSTQAGSGMETPLYTTSETYTGERYTTGGDTMSPMGETLSSSGGTTTPYGGTTTSYGTRPR